MHFITDSKDSVEALLDRSTRSLTKMYEHYDVDYLVTEIQFKFFIKLKDKKVVSTKKKQPRRKGFNMVFKHLKSMSKKVDVLYQVLEKNEKRKKE